MKIKTMISVACLGAAIASNSFAAQQPNIIVIMTDDLGYGDVSSYGAKVVQTPQIDRIAETGIRFTNGYVSSATCTPTRYSLITGNYAFRQKGTGIAPPDAPAIIKDEVFTIADLAKQAGYHTAVIGKWHLGLGHKKPNWNGELKPGPLEIGFDYSFILPTTGDRVPSVYVENHHVVNWDQQDPIATSRMSKPFPGVKTGKTHRDELSMDWKFSHNGTINNGISRIGHMKGGDKALWRDEDLADEFTARAVKYIADHKSDPFFLYFATHEIHVPRRPHERFQGKSVLGPRGDAILAADWSVGQILDQLDKQGLRDNTLVVFTSDNGPVLGDGYKDQARELNSQYKHTPAGPLTGTKYSPYEGGTRVPFIVSWPERIKPAVSDTMLTATDLMNSFAQLWDLPLPAGSAKDSFNILPALLGEKDAKGVPFVVQHAKKDSKGYRQGDWKLIKLITKKKNKNKADKGQKKKAKFIQKVRYQLFNLKQDIAEKHDLSAQYPERLEAMKAKLESIISAGHVRPDYKD